MDAMERKVNRETLKYLVQRKIQCALTGEVLDMRRAVAVTATANGKSGTSVFTAAAYDRIAEKLSAAADAVGGTVEVLDGRKLFGRAQRVA
jgi:hypothetical protein